MAESPQPAGDPHLAAWLGHEADLRARLATEPGRATRRALWRGLADARRLLERIDPARRAAGAGLPDPDAPHPAAPPALEQVLARCEDEWASFLDRLDAGPGRGPDATP